MNFTLKIAAALCLPVFAATAGTVGADAPAASVQKPAALVAQAQTAPILGAAHAGKRIVAVGDHGVVLLSDDEGRSFRQAKAVPTQALLTSVFFVDDQLGWAAGHDGVILRTQDGGDTWTLQREDTGGDRPLFSIYFRDALHGMAVGLFGTAVQTADGGQTWTPLAVESPPAGAAASDDADSADHHLYAIFGDAGTGLFIAAETGLIYRSADAGATWSAVKTANPGSFWCGAQLRDGSLLAAGQRGHVFASRDHGQTWDELPSGTHDSLTAIVQQADGTVLITALGGTTLTSADNGKTFAAHSRDDRIPLTAALPAGDRAAILFGGTGVVR